MKKLCLLLLLFLSHFLLMPLETTHAKGKQEPVPDTVADSHSKYSAYYQVTSTRFCSAILISSTAALTAKHCVGAKPAKRSGRIYPGLNGNKRPFGYMNISTYTPHPNPKYDIAIIKGTERDQDRFYKYYIKKFTTTVRGYTDDELSGFVGDEVYSYGYPNRKPAPIKVQYRSDGQVYKHLKSPKPYLLTDMPAYDGQSGSGVFKKDGSFIGIIITRTKDNKANTLPFTEDIAKWINKNAK
ncbi:trypsin-like serine protease [Staphylococcus pseudintermedius]|nr:serine protease [Staphylococcus pseudintermedius]EGQ3163802.1 trypsin-like serine protease [Staphylococcus pseudintermedius]EGQ3351887.1 trypsin-like serine protease [Staphylococcus pseudintermedius]EGQ3739052.1 trypsin-like serine protease [Staphylococcus pseudintermedius]EHC9947843.1 trypsin-like serine protease [Staphylococcus pseudintermedius]